MASWCVITVSSSTSSSSSSSSLSSSSSSSSLSYSSNYHDVKKTIIAGSWHWPTSMYSRWVSELPCDVTALAQMSPLLFWKKFGSAMPILSTLARRYFAVPMTTVRLEVHTPTHTRAHTCTLTVANLPGSHLTFARSPSFLFVGTSKRRNVHLVVGAPEVADRSPKPSLTR